MHKSLRCSNIFIHSSGQLLLTDYGFRFLLGDDISMRGPPTLTPHSMAPRVEVRDAWLPSRHPHTLHSAQQFTHTFTPTPIVIQRLISAIILCL